jgi:NAD(P)-dependent dehydrogenase (short-subunit alcohol dehydrogenase family)
MTEFSSRATPTIGIVGAGPGLGLSIARVFGAHGYDVALISRNQATLDSLVATLAEEQVTAAGFAADVTDRPELSAAIEEAVAHFGGIDVLEYSPADRTGGPLAPVDVREATPENTQPQIEYYLYGAMTAAQAVLPAMLEAGAGTLLFTTGGGSTYPVPMFGNVNTATGALRNWALNLGAALADDGVFVGHVAIGVWITDEEPPPGAAALPAREIAPHYWDLHRRRDEHELIVTGSVEG